jgi:hypothetical protein
VITGNNSSNHRPLGFIAKAPSFEALKELVKQIDGRIQILDNELRDILIHGLHFAA